MVKFSSTMDKSKRAFKSAFEHQDVQVDDNPSSSDASDTATLAVGLDSVDGLNDEASEREVKNGESTKVTRLVYDEYDPSNP